MLISEFCKFRMVFISSKLQTQNFLPLELFLFWIMILLALVGCELSSLLWYLHKHHSFCKESLITFIKKKGFH